MNEESHILEIFSTVKNVGLHLNEGSMGSRVSITKVTDVNVKILLVFHLASIFIKVVTDIVISILVTKFHRF